MTIEDYLRYCDYFSSGKFDDWYTDDVQVVLRTVTLDGKPAVKAFYEAMFPLVHETLRVTRVESGEDWLVADVWSDFYCRRDWPEFPIKPMKAGEMLRVPMRVTYKIRDGRFCHIKGERRGEPVSG